MWTAYFFSLACNFFVLIFFSLLLYYVYFKAVGSKYWKKRNVFHLEPQFVLGNDWKGLLFDNVSFVLEARYRKWKSKKLVGYWSFTTPSLLVTDLDLVRRILVRDFDHFVDRNINVNENIDPLAGHLVNLRGAKWRHLRAKLTPTFTSGKMKMMFPIMVECGQQLEDFLRDPAKNGQTLEMREIFARFTTDIISSCAFGIESNCVRDPHSEFRRQGRRIFEPGFNQILRFLLTTFFPRLRDIFRIRIIPKDLSDFFVSVVAETMESRQRNKIRRNDFLQLLMQLKNEGKVEDADPGGVPPIPNDISISSPETTYSHSSKKQLESDSETNKKNESAGESLSLNQAAAQAFVFFAAGFETSSTTLAYAAYELALNPDIQAEVRREIRNAVEAAGGRITYDALVAMEYLDRVVQETLRKYPPLALLGRKCTKSYAIPEMGVELEEGTRVLLSVLGFHRDPDIFPEPEKFDPERFSPEEKAKRHKMCWLPFGEGPRNCIGSRFGLLQTKVGLASVLSSYEILVAEETPVPLVFDKKAFILTPKGGIPLKLVQCLSLNLIK